jgi:hypothetical protein
MNNQADAIAALYESGFSSASYIFGLRPLTKVTGDRLCNSTAWPMVPNLAKQVLIVWWQHVTAEK